MPERSDTKTSKNASEFRASIIPYDTSENPNAPILASSGDNINLIFTIPKESFRKLALAAIEHLDSNSDFEHAATSNGNKGISNGSKVSDNNKNKRDNEISKFRLSDIVNNLGNENTKDIIDAFEEDGNTSDSSKNKDVILADTNLCVKEGANESMKADESVPNDHETENQSPEISSLEDSRENENDRLEVLSDYNPDLSDCPELKNVWPNINPFTKTEKVPIEEMESFLLNGFITKYLKLEVSNEFVILKVTSESNVIVDAVKYKETGKECIQKAKGNFQNNVNNEQKEQSSDKSGCSDNNGDTSQALQTTVSNNDVDSTYEIDSSVNENEIGDSVEKFLENAELRETSSKIEEKLEELDNDISGSSPIERLKFALRERLKKHDGKMGAEKQTEECVADSKVGAEKQTEECVADSKVDAEKQTEESVASVLVEFCVASKLCDGTSESDNSQTQEKCLEDSVDECAIESLEMVDSNEMTVVCHETEYSDKELKTENELPKTDSKLCSMSPEKMPVENSLNETESVNEASTAVGKLTLNNFEGDSSLDHVEETNLKKSSIKSEEKDSFEDSALGKDLHLSENEAVNDCSKLEVECKETEENEYIETISHGIPPNNSCEPNDEMPDPSDIDYASQHNHDEQNEKCEIAVEESCHPEVVKESIKLENFEDSLAHSFSDGPSENKSTDNTENSSETNIEGFKSESNKDLKDITEITENDSENLVADIKAEGTSNETSASESSEGRSKSLGKESSESGSQNLEDSISETTDVEEKLPENSFASNTDSIMDTTVDTNIESASECGDLESDDIKSVASESDDSKDGDKKSSMRRNRFKKNKGADEVDCAPTRSRRKAIAGLSKDSIPENAELKNTNVSNVHSLTPCISSERSGKISPIGRSLRSKSLDPDPQPSKGNLYGKKHSIIESEESTRRTRAKTPDIVGKKDLKTTVRSSPRKVARSSATAEPSSTSKVQNTKTSTADSKSRANLDFSMSSKRSKRGSRE